MERRVDSNVEEKPSQAITVFVTTASEEEAATIGRAVVTQRLAACANVLTLKKSIFQWEGKICEEPECLMIVKSRLDLFEELSVTVKQLHSYTVPEIVAIPIVAGSPDYLNWIAENTRK
jgi:periplasmic divalent cation tolerance protein